jgi:hypothetical protein
MRLLEELRRGPILARGVPLGYLDTAVALLEDAVPVLVDNVARWYGEESPQEQWELNTDFPNVAFVKLRGYPAAYVGGYSYPISAAGQFVETPHHPGTYLYGIDAPLFSLAIAEKMHADGMAPLHVPLLATSFCHCKNVVLRDDVPPPKLAAAQFKRHGAPKITYKTLEIGPMLGTLQTEGGMNQGNTAQKALHICRGHFMDYREGAGLFGKHHGLYWKDMHVRGRNRQGVVIKDYAIATPEKEPA